MNIQCWTIPRQERSTRKVICHRSCGDETRKTCICSILELVKHRVDGRTPAPVDMVNIPLFKGCYTFQVVQDFSHQQYHLWNGIIFFLSVAHLGSIFVGVPTISEVITTAGGASWSVPWQLQMIQNWTSRWIWCLSFISCWSFIILVGSIDDSPGNSFETPFFF